MKCKGMGSRDRILRLNMVWYGLKFWVVEESQEKIQEEKQPLKNQVILLEFQSRSLAQVGPGPEFSPGFKIYKVADQTGLIIL